MTITRFDSSTFDVSSLAADGFDMSLTFGVCCDFIVELVILNKNICCLLGKYNELIEFKDNRRILTDRAAGRFWTHWSDHEN